MQEIIFDLKISKNCTFFQNGGLTFLALSHMNLHLRGFFDSLLVHKTLFLLRFCGTIILDVLPPWQLKHKWRIAINSRLSTRDPRGTGGPKGADSKGGTYRWGYSPKKWNLHLRCNTQRESLKFFRNYSHILRMNNGTILFFEEIKIFNFLGGRAWGGGNFSIGAHS